MPIPVVCPSCGHRFNVPDKYAGKRGKCPECANVFRAPTLEEASEARQAQGTAAATEAPPVSEELIPVGVPLEEPALGAADAGGFSPPAPAFVFEGGGSASGAYSTVRRGPQRGAPPQNPLLLAAAGGGAVLLAVLLAVAVWASGLFSHSENVAAKPAKKTPQQEDDIELAASGTAAPRVNPTGGVSGTPSVPAPLPSVPVNPGAPGESLGALPEFEKPADVIPPPSIPVPAPKPEALSAESMRQLAGECAEIGRPTDAEQYYKYQQLALTLTLLKAAEERGPGEAPPGGAEAVQETLEKLAAAPWPAEADLAAVNRLAAAALKESELGVFAYGTVRGGGQSGGRNFILMDLGGAMETLAMPVKTELNDTPPGSRWLVLGQRVPNNFLQVRESIDGVERSFNAALVVGIYLVGEPKSE